MLRTLEPECLPELPHTAIIYNWCPFLITTTTLPSKQLKSPGATHQIQTEMLTHTVLLLALAVCSLASSSTPERFEQVRRRDSTFVAREHHPDLLQKRHRKPLAKRACKSKSRQSSSTAQTSSAVPSQATSSVSASNKNVNTESSSSGSSGSSSNSTSSSSDDSSTSSVGLPSGITHFTGQNSGIGSWFRTNNGMLQTRVSYSVLFVCSQAVMIRMEDLGAVSLLLELATLDFANILVRRIELSG